MKTLSLFLLFLGFALSHKHKSKATSEPDQIIELFRHGARGPVTTFDSSWPLDQLGMLTSVGMRQHYILGKVLAEKYPDLIGSTYNYSQLYVISDTTPRCIQSAVSHLYGMYLGTGPSLPNNYPPELAIPPYKDTRVKNIADSLPDSQALPYNFVPGVVNIVDVSNGYIFQGDIGTYCPNQAQWEAENLSDNLTIQAFEIFGDTIANINKLLNESQQLTTPLDILSFGDAFAADLYDNRTLPGGITDPQLINNATWTFTWFIFHLWIGQAQQRQLAAFNLVQTILGQMESFRTGQNYSKVVLLSGHDDNIVDVLAAFGVINEDCVVANFYSTLANGTLQYPACYYPFFASDLIVEFYNETDTPYVKFYYNNLLIPLCNGQDTCSYDDFVAFAQNATGNNTLDSYFQQCGANSTYLSSMGYTNVTPAEYTAAFIRSTSNPIRMEILAIVGLAIICVSILVKMIFDKKQYHETMKNIRQESRIYTLLN